MTIPKGSGLTKFIYNRMEAATAFWFWSHASARDTRTLQTEELQVKYTFFKTGVVLVIPESGNSSNSVAAQS